MPTTLTSSLIDRWKLLRSNYEQQDELAGIFLGYKPKTYDEASKKLLYIGKATAKSFHEKDAHERSFGGESAYWRFGEALSRQLDDRSRGLSNMAWSNIFKIGTRIGNPGRKLQHYQKCLAVESLTHELVDCSPSLIVITAASFGLADEIVYKALGVERGNDGFNIVNDGYGEHYYRGSVDGFAPILWVPHPQRKSTGQLARWLGTLQAMQRQGMC